MIKLSKMQTFLEGGRSQLILMTMIYGINLRPNRQKETISALLPAVTGVGVIRTAEMVLKVESGNENRYHRKMVTMLNQFSLRQIQQCIPKL